MGKPLSLYFAGGQHALAGDMIADLDPRPFQAAARQTAGNVCLDEVPLEESLYRLLNLALARLRSLT